MWVGGLRPRHRDVGRDRKCARDRLRLAVVVIDRTELVAVARTLLAGNRNFKFLIQGKVILENRPLGRLALAVFPELALNHTGRRVRTESRNDAPDHGSMQGDVRDTSHSRRLRPCDCQGVGRRDRHEACVVNRLEVSLHPVVHRVRPIGTRLPIAQARSETHLVHNAVETTALAVGSIRIVLRGAADADVGVFQPHLYAMLRHYLVQNAVGVNINDWTFVVCRILPDKVNLIPDAIQFQHRSNRM